MTLFINFLTHYNTDLSFFKMLKSKKKAFSSILNPSLVTIMIQQNIIYCRVKFVNSNFSFTALMICSDFLWSMKPHIHKPRFPVKLHFVGFWMTLFG